MFDDLKGLGFLFVLTAFVSFEVACLLGFVFAGIALEPNDVNFVNISFMSLDAVCVLCFVVA